jgi:hypothetical protein
MSVRWYLRFVSGGKAFIPKAPRRRSGAVSPRRGRRVGPPLTLEALEDRTALSAFSGGPLAGHQPAPFRDSRSLADSPGNVNGDVAAGAGVGAGVGSGRGYPLPPAAGPTLAGHLVAFQAPAAVFLTDGAAATVTDGAPPTLVPTLLGSVPTRTGAAPAAGAGLPGVVVVIGGGGGVMQPAAGATANGHPFQRSNVSPSELTAVSTAAGGQQVTVPAAPGATSQPGAMFGQSQTPAALPVVGVTVRSTAILPPEQVGSVVATPVTAATAVEQQPAGPVTDEGARRLARNVNDTGVTGEAAAETHPVWTTWTGYHSLAVALAVDLLAGYYLLLSNAARLQTNVRRPQPAAPTLVQP